MPDIVMDGHDGSVALGVNTVLQVQSWKLNRTKDIKKTDWKGAASSHKNPGIRDWNADITVVFNPTDTNGQKALEDAYENDTLIQNLKLVLDGSHGYYGPDTVADPSAGAYVKDFNINDPESGAVTADIKLEGSGPIKWNA